MILNRAGRTSDRRSARGSLALAPVLRRGFLLGEPALTPQSPNSPYILSNTANSMGKLQPRLRSGLFFLGLVLMGGINLDRASGVVRPSQPAQEAPAVHVTPAAGLFFSPSPCGELRPRGNGGTFHALRWQLNGGNLQTAPASVGAFFWAPTSPTGPRAPLLPSQVRRPRVKPRLTPKQKIHPFGAA